MAEKIIYSKFSNDRATKYCIATDIIEKDSKRIVRKRALNDEAKSHILRLKDMEEKLNNVYDKSCFKVNHVVDFGENFIDYEYIQGKSFDSLLDEFLEKKDINELLQKMKDFFDELRNCSVKVFVNSDEFKHFFGDADIDSNELAMPFGNIDLIFQNVIVDENNIWNVIDYEWTIDCLVPIRYIEYRAILLYVYGLSKRNRLIEENIFEKMGLSEKDISVFDKMEKRFQHVIKENHKQLGDLYQVMKAPGFQSNEIFHEREKEVVEVYFDDGDGFTETTKKVFMEFPIQIPLYDQLKAIRIDPMPSKGFVKVNTIVDDKGNVYSYSSDGYEYEKDLFYFNQDDPKFFLNQIYVESEYIVIDMKIDIVGEQVKNIIDDIQINVHNLEQEKENQILINEQLNLQLGSANFTIEAMKQSLSWRITKPLRFIFEKTYKFIRKFKITSLIYDGIKYLVHFGIRSTFRRIKELYGGTKNELSEENFVLSDKIIKEQKNRVFEKSPKISILVPLYNTPDVFLKEMIESVQNQTYANWELCLADGSDDEHSKVGKLCDRYCRDDSRIVYKKLTENKGISDNTNECIKMATGDYIGLFDHDDLLTQDALFEVVNRINEKENVDVVYTDEDKLLYNAKDKSAKYVEPHCKSDFNLDLLRTNNYICHFFVVKKNIVDKVGGFRKAYDGSQDFDFIFRCVEQAKNVEHVAKILYHWRIHANSTAANPQSKMYCYEAGKHAIESHLERMGIEATVEMTEHLGFYRVKYPVKGRPLVSIIIPNKDEKDTLDKCIQSILQKTTYENYEIIIVENNSKTKEIFDYYNKVADNKKIKIEYWKDEFNFSKINNFGVEKSNGEYILLLNNDVEIISDNWIEEMLSNCQRREVGITGAKLIYPDNTVQHAGVIIGLGGIAGHAFVGLDANHPGYFGRAFVQQNVSAVTAACFMISREIYNEVDGLEDTLKVAFNDVDFCLKVRKAGYLIVMNPNVKLYHYESKSRGAEDTPEKKARFESEVKYMADKWVDILKSGDPYYNRNLTLVRGDFSLKGESEIMF